ncbi:MAG: hypothetical protein NHB15_08190 [Methanosarcina barkeri]|nr:hypothetical protein [Methanosarcina sp. ERenArc_MAG2]
MDILPTITKWKGLTVRLEIEKTMRGLKIKETPILKGIQMYHNFIRPQKNEGKTPAEACGIELNGENKWITLIQNASMTYKKLKFYFI